MKNLAKNLSSKHRPVFSKAGAFLVGIFAALSSLPAASVDISTSPLYLGSDVPGNLALVPSVEFPTVISVANLTDTYTTGTKFIGYFDPNKCYAYKYSAIETERYFYPVGPATGFACDGTKWSGNFMNWAVTQTIDPFRSALTGGYRVKDDINETWIEKAIADRASTSNFPRRSLNGGGLTSGATPVRWSNMQMRIDGLGNQMWFTSANNRDELTATSNQPATLQAYNPAVHPLDGSNVNIGTPLLPVLVKGDALSYAVSIRVKVCDASVGLEANCVRYPSGYYKPEGLIQQYSDRIRYSIFGYQNVDGSSLDGGVLRANQKFVGPLTYNPEEDPLVNPNREWSAATGVLVQNPDPVDAAATTAAVGKTVDNSGVINYLNKFGQMKTGKVGKSQDNVSELYYAAVRYFKHLGNVPAYTNLGAGNAANKYQRVDGFPVITDWKDPIKYQCQTNVILGIGDTNTWQDKNLPSLSATNATDEPAKPQEVKDDKTVDVIQMMKKIWRMEGKTDAQADTLATAQGFNDAGRANSAYIAALAYDSHTRDIRPEGQPNAIAGKQTISTHWVDVIEGHTNGDYKMPASNQYWYATKYGGFSVPEGYDPDSNVTALPLALWSTTGDRLPLPASPTPRPDNFYAAADAQKMIDSLTKAFARILAEMKGSGSGLASNTTRLEAGAMTFQAQYYSGTWGGELTAFNVNPTTAALTTAWSATTQLPLPAARKIYRVKGTTLASVQYGDLAGTPLAGATQNEIDYLRGDRTKEAPSGTLRQRRSALGDIVNSQPVYVGTPNGQLYKGATFTGASLYPAFVAANAASARPPVVYVGANDGMLHAFNATTGAEMFAFMPTAAMSGLTGPGGYTDPAYTHRYFVDGDLTVADVFVAGSWKTVLVGSLGRGGRSLFALDVTNPAAPTLLWEKNQTDIPALGNNLNKPIIGQLADGDWRVIVGNGPNSTGTNAQLIMVGIGNGAVTTRSTGVGGDNGLSGVNPWASTSSGFVDNVYAGDLQGNLWKFTGLTGAGVVTKLFAAGATQPITSMPLVSKNPTTGDTWVFLGTGRYLNVADTTNKDVQSWYGLIDKSVLISRSNLRSTAILDEVTMPGGTVERVLESYATSGLSGWYMDLVSPAGAGGARGERMVVPNYFQGLALIGTTRIPESGNVCSPSGTGFTMAIDPFTGGRLANTFFDTNGDGVFDTNDLVNGHPVSGIGGGSSPINSIFLGDTLFENHDNGTVTKVKTNSGVMNVTRVSWREIIRD